MAILNSSVPTRLRVLERAARRVMGSLAILGAICAISFKAGLLSTSPTYERQSWYLVEQHGSIIVTKELDDEAACRKQETLAAVCRSGANMMDRPVLADAR